MYVHRAVPIRHHFLGIDFVVSLKLTVSSQQNTLPHTSLSLRAERALCALKEFVLSELHCTTIMYRLKVPCFGMYIHVYIVCIPYILNIQYINRTYESCYCDVEFQ